MKNGRADSNKKRLFLFGEKVGTTDPFFFRGQEGHFLEKTFKMQIKMLNFVYKMRITKNYLMEELRKDKSDSELVELSKDNSEFFEELVIRYERRLFSFVRRISYFSQEDIEDIVQDSFVKVYKNLNAFDDTFEFSTWIYRITRNTTFDAIRRKNARPQAARLEEEDFLKIFRSTIDLEKEMIALDDFEKLKKVIDEMPIKYKEIFVLKFIEEKTYEEIMDIVKKPKGTIATLVSRGRKMVVDKMRDEK